MHRSGSLAKLLGSLGERPKTQIRPLVHAARPLGEGLERTASRKVARLGLIGLDLLRRDINQVPILVLPH
jgi:hypothetical protein